MYGRHSCGAESSADSAAAAAGAVLPALAGTCLLSQSSSESAELAFAVARLL